MVRKQQWDVDWSKYTHGNNPKVKKVVDDMMLQLDLTEIWRERNPDKTESIKKTYITKTESP